MLKPHRVYRGNRCCAICYARVFKPRPCPRCGERARLPRDDPRAVCRRCAVDRPCVRCGKTGYRVDRITPYGPVCKACARYFRPAEPCQACGALSRYLTGQEGLRLCPRCVPSERATCPACHRHRRLLEAPEGRRLCRACLERGEVACPSCGQPMPAGRGRECADCYWRRVFATRLQLDRAAFSRNGMAGAFAEFGAWLLQQAGPRPAALRIHRYLPFFLEMERSWGAIPSYPALVEHFGVEGLRRFRLATRWLEEEKGVLKKPRPALEDAEKRQVETLLAAFPTSTVAGRCLQGYKVYLMERVENRKTSLRSVRLAMRPAVSLLAAADPQGGRLPDQAALERYLLRAPGQRMALTGFLVFLRYSYGLNLRPVVDAEGAARLRRRELEKELIRLAAGHAPSDPETWVRLALEYFHGLRLSRKALRKAVLREEDGGLCVKWEGVSYWIPAL